MCHPVRVLLTVTTYSPSVYVFRCLERMENEHAKGRATIIHDHSITPRYMDCSTMYTRQCHAYIYEGIEWMSFWWINTLRPGDASWQQ